MTPPLGVNVSAGTTPPTREMGGRAGPGRGSVSPSRYARENVTL